MCDNEIPVRLSARTAGLWHDGIAGKVCIPRYRLLSQTSLLRQTAWVCRRRVFQKDPVTPKALLSGMCL